MLTKSDLSAIDQIIVKRIKPLERRIITIEGGMKRIEKKFDELFDFLDRKYLDVKRDVRTIQTHLHLPTSPF